MPMIKKDDMSSQLLAFNLLTQPIGAISNLGHKHCFFLSMAMLYPGNRFRMCDKIL
jgi:hypothetical protein